MQKHEVIWFLGISLVLAGGATAQAAQPKLTLQVRERGQTPELPCRIHLQDAAGLPVRAPGLPFFRDHFVCPGRVQLPLAPGTYSYEIERGPEYQQARGRVTLEESDRHLVVDLERIADLAREGWWSGELHVHRPVEDIPLLMQAEDLRVAPVITWWNDQNRWAGGSLPEEPLVRLEDDRYYHVMGGEDEREGGALLYFNLAAPLPITGASREFPSPMRFLEAARQHPNVWIDIEKPFWWDVPVWVASRKVDSIGLANNHMCREQMYEDEAWGKPRDTQRWPAPRGNGFWTQEIYYQLLNCGLRLPPTAGSASGVLPNPVGYNRVYVFLGPELEYGRWWEGLRAGRSFVSNGPLLRCRANGQWPGHVFRSAAGQPIDIELEATLTSRDPVSSFEIIRDGRLERSVPVSKTEPARLGSIRFQQSGWFLVRTITDHPKTFRFASTAPFYVEVGANSPRISHASAQFFVDWVRQRKNRIRLPDPEQQRQVLAPHDAAETFWLNRLARANAD